MTARSFVWLSIGGGAWSLAANWDDVTDGVSPSLLVPGPGDSVTVSGPSGAAVQTMTGPGAAASAMFAGNTLLSGAFTLGTVTLGAAGSGGLLQLGAATLLQAGSASIDSGSMLAGAGGTLVVAGALLIGQASGAAASLNVTGGGRASAQSLSLGSSTDSLYVDPASVFEIGDAGDGVAGLLTIDPGALLSGQGDADAFGAIANQGTIEAAGGTLALGTLSGAGTLQIGAGATLALNGACAAGQNIVFAGANATLALDAEFDAPAGSVARFAPGDAIDVRGSQITAADFTPTGANGGVLTLSYGGQVAALITLAGSYTGSLFLTAGDGAGGTLITVAPNSGGGGPVSPGTPTPDAYGWIASGSGAWNNANNWQDLTVGADPAAIAPGANDSVALAVSQGSFSVIAGPANATSVAVTGEAAFSGAFGIGTLTVGQSTAGTITNATLDVLAGTTVGATTAGLVAGEISVSGSAALLSVSGTLALGGGPSGVGLPVTLLTAGAGGGIRTACLVLGGGAGDSIATDPTGWVEIGTAGGAAAGAVTIDPGATLQGNGSVNPLGSLIDNGSILASLGTLTLGRVSGAGTLDVAQGATVRLLSTTALPIDLQGAAATVAFAGAAAAPTGTISGFAPGDLLHLEGSQVTSVFYAPTTGALTLVYGTAVVAQLTLSGSFAGERFVTTPDGVGGTDITVATATGGGGGGGQTGTDVLAWTQPVSGNFNRASNWTDVTIGAQATQPPGAQTPVQIAGPTGIAFQSVTGTGSCASLAFTGNTALTGDFITGQLIVGQPGTSPVASILDLPPDSALTAASGMVADGELLSTGLTTLLDVTGTLTLGSEGASALLAAQGRGAIQLGALALLAGASVTADLVSSVEIGTLGAAAPGDVTVDPGFTASGAGMLAAAGTVVDNGLIEAEGGTLLVGATSGTGTLSIGIEAALSLAAGASCPIAFSGGGATLVLPGTTEGLAAQIAGFAPGDSIVIAGSPVDSVLYQPGAAGPGTLSLFYGGQLAEQLLLDGNFAGEVFAVQPDGTGALISVAAPAGPPQGTVGPDHYVWTGDATSFSLGYWAYPGNWTDLTQAQAPAAVAPGQNDIVSIAGPTGSVLQVQGPADAAALSLSGTVALAGAYSIGTLSVGGTLAALLALGAGAAISAASASIIGGLTTDDGDLAVSGTLTLGSQAAAGILSAGGASQIDVADRLVLAGTGSVLAAGPNAAIEIGGTAGAAPGSITVDADGTLLGDGEVAPGGVIADAGTITASGGTLVLGSVSGLGTLLVGVGATLVLDGAASAGLTADFAGAGTLNFTQTPAGNPAVFGPVIADFGPGDEILLPEAGITTASYALTGPGEGVLSLFDGDGLVAELTLLGSQAGLAYSLAGAAGGGTILTSTPDNMSGQGGTPMSTPIATGNIYGPDLEAEFQSDFPYIPAAVIQYLVDVVGENDGSYQFLSPDGSAPTDTPFGALGAGPGVDVEIVGPLNSVVGGGSGPGSALALAPGFSALVAEGSENIGLTDEPNGVPLGNALIAGNAGQDTLVAGGNNDTLVGATGANTLFAAALATTIPSSAAPNVYIHGGGDDTITTGDDNAAITTSGGRSELFLGTSANDVLSNGSDTIFCSDGASAAGGCSDTVISAALAGQSGDVIYGPSDGLLSFTSGAAASTIVGGGGQLLMYGGAANGGLLFAGSSPADYFGGAGSEVIVGGSSAQTSLVQGGAGPVTVFGGFGPGIYSGGPGSAFVIGAGTSTVTAAAGDLVWVTGNAQVSVAGSGTGAEVYGGTATGNDIYQAGAGNETLWGGLGNDLFIAGRDGTDIFTSGGGDDVFSFLNGSAGADVDIVGFVTGQDSIALHGYGDQVPAITVAFGDSIMNLSDGTQIVVEGVTNLTAASFVLT